jgi:hypothetical protein
MSGDEWVRQVLGDLGEIKVTLAAQHVTLQEHQRRSLASEKAIEALRTELQPLKTHVALWGALGKILGAAGVLAGIIETALKLSGK